jgi:aminopeptidase N
MTTVRWNIAVSPEVDQSVRMFIAAQGGGRKGDLSRFIEDAVRAYLLERAVDQAKVASSNMSEAELNDLIDEAVHWARRSH